ncbi:MAG: FeoA family protein [Absicoccus porci]|jgi:ferrous iron transport protein A|uniref:Ferrous iron transport protein A n=1 Tax=Absicoccus porci TaxID=2486576 RepID=A0A3N0HWA9_9FIRM|nr:FeoA family protein [Absicoccus porci]MCI6088782.1 ferrous iron transport protein A [Absicoccus porci]MDD6460071.1 FeoA family protein [Absicoccus porci]MDD7329929.1 FeoA family protein [Absicoccus porci]MDY4738097.1 FeoA family protein [Absicoccus porci]MEE1355139.1 FeoA family protein [Absicoccus porci]
MPLSLADMNTVYVVKRVTGNDQIRKHLATLGFVEGAEVQVVQSIDGNLIVEVKNVRVAIDESLARRVMV